MQWNINCLRIALMLVAAATVHGQVPRPSTQQTRPRTGAVPATRGYSQPPAWAAVSKPGLAWDYVLQGTVAAGPAGFASQQHTHLCNHVHDRDIQGLMTGAQPHGSPA